MVKDIKVMNKEEFNKFAELPDLCDMMSRIPVNLDTYHALCFYPNIDAIYRDTNVTKLYFDDVMCGMPLCVPYNSSIWRCLTDAAIEKNAPEMYIGAVMKQFYDMLAINDSEAKNILKNMKDDFERVVTAFGPDRLRTVTKEVASNTVKNDPRVSALLEDLVKRNSKQGVIITPPIEETEHPEDDQETILNAGMVYPLIFNSIDLTNTPIEVSEDMIKQNNEEWASMYPRLNRILDETQGQFQILFMKVQTELPSLSYMNLHDMYGNFLYRFAIDTGSLYGMGETVIVPIGELMDMPAYPIINSFDKILDLIFGRTNFKGLVNELGSEITEVCRKVDMSSLPKDFDPAKGYSRLIQNLTEALGGKVAELGDFRYRFAEFKAIDNFKLTTDGAKPFFEMTNAPKILDRDHVTVTFNGKAKSHVKYTVDVTENDKNA